MGAAISELLSRLGSRIESAESLSASLSAGSTVLRLGWPELDDALPDGGFPRDARSWCAWVDPESTLYAPGVAFAGVDLARLLVVRPSRAEMARVAVKVAASRAFDVIAVDVDVVPGSMGASGASQSSKKKRAWPMDVLVRKLALLAAEGGATVLLLSDSSSARAVPWPVALRLDLSRTQDGIALRVAKDRKGRVGLAKTVPLCSRPTLERPTLQKNAG